ncbi:hypothetical protein AB0C15_01835 [Micromonospora sp. NPDC048835]|uniref:hypothetical protein n=1 Tax=Micromonospora sp. NPDC048835 TaxID=3155147 RepID=UPI0033F8AC2F
MAIVAYNRVHAIRRTQVAVYPEISQSFLAAQLRPLRTSNRVSATAYTGAVPAEITSRLLAGDGQQGAYTPAALFGSALAESCGGEYLLARASRQ